MKQKSLINAVKKTGLDIKVKDNRQYYAEGPTHCLSWYVQDENAICVHIQRNGDESDPYTDYFPGFFPSTIKHAMTYLIGR